MKFSRLAPRANPCGALHPRVFTPASPDGDPHFSKLERFRNLLGLLSFSLCTFSAAQTWTPEVQTGISRYLVSYGTSPGAHTTTVDVGAQSGFTLTGLQEGITYYAVVTAVSTTGVMSQPSAEISYKVPVTSVTPAYVISRNGWRLHYVDSQESGTFSGAMAFDGNPNTFWHTAWTTGTTPQPHVIQIDLGMDHPVSGFRYLPRQDGIRFGNIVQYEFLTSLDGIVWSGPAASGSFAVDGTEKEVLFPSRQARFVMLRSLSEANGGNDTNIAELNILESEITENPVNQAPVADAKSVTTQEDQGANITLSGSDADEDAISYQIISGPGKGNLTGIAPNLVYLPAADYSGTDQFSYTVNDGQVDSPPATVIITVSAVNDAPVAVAKSVSTNEDLPVSVLLSGTDKESSLLSYTVVSQPGKGSLTGVVPNLTYTPNPDVNGDDSFTYKVSDGALQSTTATVSINIAALNDAPVAQSGGATTNEDTSVSVTLSASDKEGTPLNYSILSSPTKGSLTGTAPNLVYTPHADVNGTDSFTYNVNDGRQFSNTGTITIQIVAVNDTPVALARSVDTSEELAVAVTLAGTDRENSTLSYSIASQPSKGSLSGTAPNLLYTPAPNANGSDSFTYRVSDGSLTSAAVQVSISITPVNDAPVAQDRSISTSQGAPVAVTLSANDVDGGSLSYVIVTPPAKGSLSGVAPNLVYTPAAGSKEADSFSYRASDGSLTSNIAMVSITINPINQAPVAVAGGINTVEDTDAPIVLTASDPDGDTLGYIIQQGPQNGVLSGTAPNLTYTPVAGFIGTDSFTFKASDGSLQSNTATITIEVVSDGLSDDSKLIDRNGWVLRYVDSEESPNQLAANAFDGDPDTFWHTRWQSGATPPPHEIQIDLGKLHTLEGFRYLPRQDGFSVGGIARYEFYVSLDGTTWGTPVATGTFVQGAMEQEALFAATPARFIRLRGLSEVNGAIHCSVAELNVLGTIGADLPPTAESRSFNTSEGNPTSVALVANDPENAPLIYEILSNPGNGVLTGTAPDLIYTPSAGFSGVDSFTFRVSDGRNPSAAATVSITVKPNKIDSGNRPPVFSSASFNRSSGSEGVSYRGESLDGTATDPDLGDGLSFSKTSGPSWLRIAVNGSLSGTPPAGSEGQNRFTIRVTDEAGATGTAQLLIDIKAASLPLPWEAEKIGDVAGQLLATHDSGTFTMEGKGTLSGSSDEANFVWQMLSGDGEIIARISGMSEGDGLSRAGVMIRDSLAPNSKHVFMGVNGSGDYRVVRRGQKGNPALGKSAGKGSFPEAWVRLVRKNDIITSYKSNNGSDWKRVGTYKVEFSAHCYIGLSMSGGKGNSATATFRNVKVKD